MRRAKLKSSSQTPFCAEKTFVSKQQNNVDAVAWALQSFAFKFQDSADGWWFVHYDADGVGVSNRDSVGGVRPNSLPFPAKACCSPVAARELAYQLLQVRRNVEARVSL